MLRMRTARCAWSAVKANGLIRKFGPMARPAPGAPANQQRRMGVLVRAKREGKGSARSGTFGLLSRLLKISAAPFASTGAAGTRALSWLRRASPGLRERSTHRPCRWNWHEESAPGEWVACAGWPAPTASPKAGSGASTATWPPWARQSTTPASDSAETVASAMAATMAPAAQGLRRCRSLTSYASTRPGDKSREKRSVPAPFGYY